MYWIFAGVVYIVFYDDGVTWMHEFYSSDQNVAYYLSYLVGSFNVGHDGHPHDKHVVICLIEFSDISINTSYDT